MRQRTQRGAGPENQTQGHGGGHVPDGLPRRETCEKLELEQEMSGPSTAPGKRDGGHWQPGAGRRASPYPRHSWAGANRCCPRNRGLKKPREGHHWDRSQSFPRSREQQAERHLSKHKRAHFHCWKRKSSRAGSESRAQFSASRRGGHGRKRWGKQSRDHQACPQAAEGARHQKQASLS